mmetsp:Transcript_55558/g.176399  ORF Transcript_55558/g.176399 Transcript_55558/m.176399 type:complete len:275 (+) Transcript_55558:69-893(+)
MTSRHTSRSASTYETTTARSWRSGPGMGRVRPMTTASWYFSVNLVSLCWSTRLRSLTANSRPRTLSTTWASTRGCSGVMRRKNRSTLARPAGTALTASRLNCAGLKAPCCSSNCIGSSRGKNSQLASLVMPGACSTCQHPLSAGEYAGALVGLMLSSLRRSSLAVLRSDALIEKPPAQASRRNALSSARVESSCRARREPGLSGASPSAGRPLATACAVTEMPPAAPRRRAEDDTTAGSRGARRARALWICAKLDDAREIHFACARAFADLPDW